MGIDMVCKVMISNFSRNVTYYRDSYYKYNVYIFEIGYWN